MHSLLLWALPLLGVVAAGQKQDAKSSAVLTVSAGKIQGIKCERSQANSFVGIPFAQPPVGQLRFMPPRLKTLARGTYHNGVLNATTVRSTCIQWHKAFAWETPPPSEDCLYLNIYVPQSRGNSSWPVKVFAFGGGNNAGAANYPLYDACALATDSIVVTFNYRLGPLGFLALEKAGIGGNMAIQDYVAALQWVHQDIGQFGGDAQKVLLFGQSAGAADGFVVSTLDEAKSLVSAVVLESGGGQDLTPNDLAQEVGESYARTLGCEADDLKCLQDKPLKDLVDARQHVPALEQNGNSSLGSEYGLNLPKRKNLNSAVLDGKIVKEEPLKVGSKVPLLTGFNQDDGSLFVIPLFPDRQSVTEKNYSDFLSQWGDAATAIGKQYPLSQFKTDGKSTGDAVVDAIIHITTTAGFTCSVYKNLRATSAAGTPAFTYLFNHTPSCSWLWESSKEAPAKEHLSLYKAAHTAELPFVFAGLSNEPWGNGSCNATESEHRLSDSMVRAWTAMAMNGDPSTKELPWGSFNANDTRGVEFGQDGAVQGTVDFTECGFWDSIWAGLGGVNVSDVSQTSIRNGSATSRNAASSAHIVPAEAPFALVVGSVLLMLGFAA